MLRNRDENSEKHTVGKQLWALKRFMNQRLKWQPFEKGLSWRRVTRKVPSWIKHPIIVDTYTRLQQTTLTTTKIQTRRAYHDLATHASTLDWPSTMASAAVFSIYLVFFSLYIHWFLVYIQDLKWFAYNGVDSQSWSFGQIVALSVWAEPLCEYFHLGLRRLSGLLTL